MPRPTCWHFSWLTTMCIPRPVDLAAWGRGCRLAGTIITVSPGPDVGVASTMKTMKTCGCMHHRAYEIECRTIDGLIAKCAAPSLNKSLQCKTEQSLSPYRQPPPRHHFLRGSRYGTLHCRTSNPDVGLQSVCKNESSYCPLHVTQTGSRENKRNPAISRG